MVAGDRSFSFFKIQKGTSIEIGIREKAQETPVEKASPLKGGEVTTVKTKMQKKEKSGSNETVLGTPIDASTFGEIKPAYPLLSRKLNEEGTARVALKMSPNGDVLEKRILLSSGYRRLDQAAMDALKGVKLSLPQKDFITSRDLILDFNFSLD